MFSRKRIKIIFAVIFLVLIAMVVISKSTPNVMPWEGRAQDIREALIWGGLAPLPEHAHSVKVRTYGGMFTRQFVVEFDASQAEIESWVKESKDLKENSPKRFFGFMEDMVTQGFSAYENFDPDTEYNPSKNILRKLPGVDLSQYIQYTLPGEEGSIGGQVYINAKTNHVIISVSWS